MGQSAQARSIASHQSVPDSFAIRGTIRQSEDEGRAVAPPGGPVPAVRRKGNRPAPGTRIIPFEPSEHFRCAGPATNPALGATFIRTVPGERLETRPNSTSVVYSSMRGRGRLRGGLPWQTAVRPAIR
jgi:hypothetical protein